MDDAEIKNRLSQQVEESLSVKKQFFAEYSDKIIEIAQMMGSCISGGGKIIICGNGGSASDSQHFSGELVGRFLKERRALPAISLATDVATLTAVGNDYGYENVFSRQVEAMAKPEDMLFAFSTSGNSPNVLKAVEVAKSRNLKCIGLTGGQGGKLADIADINLNVAAGKNSARIQEAHIMVVHLLVDLLDEYFLGN